MSVSILVSPSIPLQLTANLFLQGSLCLSLPASLSPFSSCRSFILCSTSLIPPRGCTPLAIICHKCNCAIIAAFPGLKKEKKKRLNEFLPSHLAVVDKMSPRIETSHPSTFYGRVATCATYVFDPPTVSIFTSDLHL